MIFKDLLDIGVLSLTRRFVQRRKLELRVAALIESSLKPPLQLPGGSVHTLNVLDQRLIIGALAKIRGTFRYSF